MEIYEIKKVFEDKIKEYEEQIERNTEMEKKYRERSQKLIEEIDFIKKVNIHISR